MYKQKKNCPVCGYKTLDAKNNSHDICPVCFWEDDKIQNNDPSETNGANAICLSEAIANYKIFGACEARFSDNVRQPNDEEICYEE